MAVCGILPEMNETPFKIIFRINATTSRSRCCQLHRFARLRLALGGIYHGEPFDIFA